MRNHKTTKGSSRRRKSGSLWLLPSAMLVAAILPAPSVAKGMQDEDETEPPRRLDVEEILGPPAASGNDPMKRIRELFREVEAKLSGIDLLLTDAAAGDTSRLEEVSDPGIDELLRASLERGREVQRDIEEILEIAQQLGQQQQSSSGSSGQPQPGQENQDGESPLDRGQGTQNPEATPSLPEEQPGGEEEGGAEEDPQQEPQQEDSNGQPKDPGESNDPNDTNRSGDDPPGAERGEGAPRNPADDGWGNLPRHVRDTFRSEGRGDMPARYRDWIDSYYRKLNRRGSSRR